MDKLTLLEITEARIWIMLLEPTCLIWRECITIKSSWKSQCHSCTQMSKTEERTFKQSTWLTRSCHYPMVLEVEPHSKCLWIPRERQANSIRHSTSCTRNMEVNFLALDLKAVQRRQACLLFHALHLGRTWTTRLECSSSFRVWAQWTTTYLLISQHRTWPKDSIQTTRSSDLEWLNF